MAGLDASGVYALAKQLGHSDAAAQAAVAIAYYESSFGHSGPNYNDPNGGSFGIYQFNVGGELAHFAAEHGNMSTEQAKQYVIDHPVESAAWALDPKKGYLGQALVLGEQKLGLSGGSLALFGQCPNLGGRDGNCGAAAIVYPGLGQRGDTHYPSNGFSVADAWAQFFGRGDPYVNNPPEPPPIAEPPPINDPSHPSNGTDSSPSPGIPLPGGGTLPIPPISVPTLPNVSDLIKNAINYAIELITGIDAKLLLSKGGVIGVFLKAISDWLNVYLKQIGDWLRAFGTATRAFIYKYTREQSAKVILWTIGLFAILAGLIGLAIETTEKAASSPAGQTAIKAAMAAG